MLRGEACGKESIKGWGYSLLLPDFTYFGMILGAGPIYFVSLSCVL